MVWLTQVMFHTNGDCFDYCFSFPKSVKRQFTVVEPLQCVNSNCFLCNQSNKPIITAAFCISYLLIYKKVSSCWVSLPLFYNETATERNSVTQLVENGKNLKPEPRSHHNNCSREITTFIFWSMSNILAIFIVPSEWASIKKNMPSLGREVEDGMW